MRDVVEVERTLLVSVDGPKHMEGYSLEGNARKKDLPGIIDMLRALVSSDIYSDEKLLTLGKDEGLVVLKVNRLAAEKPLEELKRFQEIERRRKLTEDEQGDQWEFWEQLMDEIVCIL